MPRERGSFDFETYEWVNPICCGLMHGAQDRRSWYFIKDIDNPRKVAVFALMEMARIAASHNVCDWYAHNGGRFDVAFMLEAIETLQWKASAHFAGGRVVTLQVTADNGKTLKLYDSQAIVPSALKRAAVDFELPNRKLFTEDDYSKDVRTWEADRLEAGCKIDCLLVLELLERVETFLDNNGGKLKPTFSSCALSVVEANCGLIDTRTWVPFNTYSRQAYAGGRVEIFRHMPAGAISEYDINSSYPYSMTTKLPWGLVGMLTKKSECLDFLQNENLDGVIEATVTVYDTFLPVLPYIQDGVFFPVGTWRGFFTKREFNYARALGHLKTFTIHSCVAYAAATPFQKFVETVYKLKSESTGAARNFYKLVLNGAYGKFGQKPEKENVHIFPSEDDALAFIMSKPSESVRVLSRNSMRFLAVSQFRWPRQTHYALAASITAESRMLLHRYLLDAQAPAYCDTDSVHGVATFETSLELGAMKLEETIKHARYYAPKMYELHTDRGIHYASKGFRVDPATFSKAIRGQLVYGDNMRLLKSQLRNGNQAARVPVSKRWSGLSAKRRVDYTHPEGLTHPWNVKELLKDEHKKSMSPLAAWLEGT